MQEHTWLALASIRSFSQREESVGLATVDDRQVLREADVVKSGNVGTENQIQGGEVGGLGIRERTRWVRSDGSGDREEDEVNGDVRVEP